MSVSWQAEILRRGHERIAKDAGTYYPHGEPDKKPTLTIVATKGNTVYVLIDQYVYNTAWSGSDWADHYILRGRATVENEALVDVELEVASYIGLTELQSDDYDTSVIRDLATRALAATVDGAPFSTDAIDKAVERMRHITAHKIDAVRARHDADRGNPPPRWPARCPKCHSNDAGMVDSHYSQYTMRCNACGNEATVDYVGLASWDP